MDDLDLEPWLCNSDRWLLASPADLDRLWARISHVAHQKVARAFDEQDDADDDDHAEAALVDFFESVCALTLAALSVEKPHWCQPLSTVIVLLHDIIFMLNEEHESLQEAILRICELCWRLDVEGKESFVPNTVSFLLLRSIGGKSTGTLVKRVYAMRTAFHLLDLDAAEDLKSLLLNCVVHPTYLKVDEGRKFLAFLFGLSLNFIDDLYVAIRKNLSGATKATCTAYGEVIFRAWKNADGASAHKLEQSVIQDLMYRAVHAARPPPGLPCTKGIASALRHLLGYIHSQKKQRGVDEMLARLYEPILWRSLNVANALVRANAAALLFDAFPIHNPDASRTEIDETLQMQFDAVSNLLHDVEPTVRVLAIHGVCRIANTFWELIPMPTITALFELLVNELSRDTASPNVRQAVCEGMRYMLDNPLALPLMRTILPHVTNLLYDTAERVRCAFVDLLIAVKDLRAIKFWKVVALEQLVHRLDEDRDQVARRITALLLKSFFPFDKPSADVVDRCETLIETNPRAARKFFIHLRKFVPIDSILNFASALSVKLLDTIESEAQDESIHDHDKTCALLDVLAICVEWGVKHTTAARREVMIAIVRHVEAIKASLAEDPQCHATTAAIASEWIMSQKPELAVQYLAKLKQMNGNPRDHPEIDAMVDCICTHGKAKNLLSLFEESLQKFLSKGINKKSKRTQQKTSAGCSMSPAVAVHVCKRILGNPQCYRALLESDVNGRQQLAGAMGDVIPNILSHLGGQGIPLSDSDLLSDVLEIYSRLALLLSTHDEDFHYLDNLAQFALYHLLSAWISCWKADSRRHHQGPTGNTDLLEDATHYMRVLLGILTEALVVGVNNDDIKDNLYALCRGVVESGRDGCWSVAPLVCKALYQLHANGTDTSALSGQLVTMACEKPEAEWSRQDTEMVKGFVKTLFHNAHLCGQLTVIDTIVETCTRQPPATEYEEHPALVAIGEVLGALSLSAIAVKQLKSIMATQGENVTPLDVVALCKALSLLKGAKAHPGHDIQTSLQRLADLDNTDRLSTYASEVLGY